MIEDGILGWWIWRQPLWAALGGAVGFFAHEASHYAAAHATGARPKLAGIRTVEIDPDSDKAQRLATALAPVALAAAVAIGFSLYTVAVGPPSLGAFLTVAGFCVLCAFSWPPEGDLAVLLEAAPDDVGR